MNNEASRDFDELQEASKALVKLLHEKYNPHTSIIVEYDRVRVVEDKIGIPTTANVGSEGFNAGILQGIQAAFESTNGKNPAEPNKPA